jgi:hypothetical protein
MRRLYLSEVGCILMYNKSVGQANQGGHLMSKKTRNIIINIIAEACIGGALGVIAPNTGIIRWLTGITVGLLTGVFLRLIANNINTSINSLVAKAIIGVVTGAVVGIIIGWGIDTLFEAFFRTLVDTFGGVVIGVIFGAIISILYQVGIQKIPSNTVTERVTHIGSGIFFGSYLGWSSAAIIGLTNIIVSGMVFGALIGSMIGVIISLIIELIRIRRVNQ